MMKKFILTLALLFNGMAKSEDKVLNPLSGHLVSDCVIYNLSGEILRFFKGGQLCQFFQDGSYVISIKADLFKKTKSNRVLFKLANIYPHHQINLNNQNNLLVMGSDTYLTQKNEQIRIDVLYIISQEGNILKRFSFQGAIDILLKNRTITEGKFDKIPEFSSFTENKLELLHVNSFYQIPKQKQLNKNPYFKENNYVVNSNNSPFLFILNESLDKIIQFIPKDRPPFPNIHDVHPTPEGNFIVYNNFDPKDYIPHSKIEIYDSNLEKKIFSYSRSKPTLFFSKIAGGSQFFSDGSFLFSEKVNDIPFINYVSKNSEIIKSTRLTWRRLSRGIQQVKVHDLSLFLKNNIPL
ncbi:MAG: hypothetical protein WC635_06700 [Bacteriovorax sp.]|jgi:hypothetical protein